MARVLPEASGGSIWTILRSPTDCIWLDRDIAPGALAVDGRNIGLLTRPEHGALSSRRIIVGWHTVVSQADALGMQRCSSARHIPTGSGVMWNLEWPGADHSGLDRAAGD